MHKDAYYFKHDANARRDPKIRAVLRKYGAAGYGWFWIIIEHLREESGYKLKYCNFIFEALADDFRCSTEQAIEFIDFLCSKEIQLLRRTDEKEKTDNGEIYFYSMSLMRRMNHLDDIREKRSNAGRSRWGVKDV